MPLLLAMMLLTQTGQSLDAIRLRDPFVLPVAADNTYYLFGTGRFPPNSKGIPVFTSRDLITWENQGLAFTPPDGFESENYWAPEVHPWRGRYYMFATFKPPKEVRGTYVLVADKPAGPYTLVNPKPVTPPDWYSLDGTLYVDAKGQPWMVFCHEWLQVVDGEICAMRLKDDLSAGVGEPRLLFKASEASWVHETGKNPRGRITDGPFLHKTAAGPLLMLWSSFGAGGYKLAVATSDSGELEGPWRQAKKPLFEADGGHGMLFRTFDGRLMLSLHQPNNKPHERTRLLPIREVAGTLELEK